MLHSLDLGKFAFEEYHFTDREISIMKVNIMKALHLIRFIFNITSLNGFQLVGKCKAINSHSVWNNQLKGWLKFAVKNHLLRFFHPLVTTFPPSIIGCTTKKQTKSKWKNGLLLNSLSCLNLFQKRAIDQFWSAWLKSSIWLNFLS